MTYDDIVAALIQCLRGNDVSHCEGCPYNSVDFRCRLKLRDDVIALLKAQEPIAPKREVRGCGWHYYCGACGVVIDGRANYCSVCGRAVKKAVKKDE